jgi:hypothetical protein
VKDSRKEHYEPCYLSGTSTRFKHNVSSVLTNLLDLPINSLKMRRHADLLIGVVCSIEEQRLAGTFMDHGPIKVE